MIEPGRISQLKWILNGSILLLCLLIFSGFSLNADSVTGLWLTQDGKAKIQIYREGKYFSGRIVWLLHPNMADGKPKTDRHNPDEKLRGRPIMGMKLLQNFKYENGNVWDEGEIYDPTGGKTYSCKMTLIDENKLEVRGYIGFSIFGRTETWTRVR